MKKFLAVDGGGTKTELLLFGEDMKIIKYIRTGATNFNDNPIEAAAVLSGALKGLRADAVYAGIAGASNCRDAISEVFRREGFPNAKIESDVMNIVLAELAERDGCCVICGTGSACFAKRGNSIKRIGGWGYLIDTGGSGFDIGRDGLEAILKHIDGRGEDSKIRVLFEARYGCLPDSMLSDIYKKGKSFIAGFSGLVFEAAAAGDMIAEKIILRNMSSLAEYIKAAGDYIGAERYTAVLSGGVLTHQKKALEALSCLAPKNAELIIARMPQICGAAIGALAILGLGTNAEQMKILLEEYHVNSGM